MDDGYGKGSESADVKSSVLMVIAFMCPHGYLVPADADACYRLAQFEVLELRRRLFNLSHAHFNSY